MVTPDEFGMTGLHNMNEINTKTENNVIKNYEIIIRVKPEDGYFVRDIKGDIVICPAGQILRKKCTKSNGYTRYMNKKACKSCSDSARCFGSHTGHKEVDFRSDSQIVKSRRWNEAKVQNDVKENATLSE